MKKVLHILGFMLLTGALFEGCALSDPIDVSVLSNSATYADPNGRFEVSYPVDWLQTEGGGEIQFWDNLDDGVNSIKMYITESEFNSFSEIREIEAVGWGPNLSRTFEETSVSDLPVLIERGASDTTEYQAYYYQLDETIYRFIAIFHDDDLNLRETATTVQQSFR